MASFYISFVFTGILSGFLSGLLGVGGGIIVVPVLVFSLEYFGVNYSELLEVATATSLAIMTLTSLSSSLSHYKNGNPYFDLLKFISPTMVIGSFIGRAINSFLPTDILMIIFIGILIWQSYKLYKNGKGTNKNKIVKNLSYKPYILSISGLAIGIFSSMVGIGGGLLLVPLLSSLGFNINRAISTSAICTFLLSFSGALSSIILSNGYESSYFMGGIIYWPGILMIAIPSLIMAPIGVRLSLKLETHLLQRVFSVILIIVAANLTWKVF